MTHDRSAWLYPYARAVVALAQLLRFVRRGQILRADLFDFAR